MVIFLRCEVATSLGLAIIFSVVLKTGLANQIEKVMENGNEKMRERASTKKPFESETHKTRFRPDRDVELIREYCHSTSPSDEGPSVLVSYSIGTDRNDLIHVWERATPLFE